MATAGCYRLMIWSESGVVSKLVTSSRVDKEYLVNVQCAPAVRQHPQASRVARTTRDGRGKGRTHTRGGGAGATGYAVGAGVPALTLEEVCRRFGDARGFLLDDGQQLLPVECSVEQVRFRNPAPRLPHQQCPLVRIVTAPDAPLLHHAMEQRPVFVRSPGHGRS